ncbi:prepilin-type N-terminal cleavage/methylation domain-containing protein, partial [Klebsiella pneumoniae]
MRQRGFTLVEMLAVV